MAGNFHKVRMVVFGRAPGHQNERAAGPVVIQFDPPNVSGLGLTDAVCAPPPVDCFGD